MDSCSGVFEGGGVRGIGHVGAVCAMEEAGYRFFHLAGSSAGAVVAALLAAGFSGGELFREMERLDYGKLKENGWPGRLGALGKGLSLAVSFGIYPMEYLGNWVEELLERKGVKTFEDIWKKGRKLWITASDVTAGRLLILPGDLEKFGLEPGKFPVWKAVQMSSAIPVFYEPCRLTDRNGCRHLIVDGGLLSNYPLWLMDGEKWPAFGFQFWNGEFSASCCQEERTFPDYVQAVAETCLDAIDRSRIAPGDGERTVKISTAVKSGEVWKNIRSTDFGIGKDEEKALFENGRRGAEEFLEHWNFERWKRKYR